MGDAGSQLADCFELLGLEQAGLGLRQCVHRLLQARVEARIVDGDGSERCKHFQVEVRLVANRTFGVVAQGGEGSFDLSVDEQRRNGDRPGAVLLGPCLSATGVALVLDDAGRVGAGTVSPHPAAQALFQLFVAVAIDVFLRHSEPEPVCDLP